MMNENCWDYRDCRYCLDCRYCWDCKHCKDCRYCKDCKNCLDCKHCENLINGFMCYNIKLKEKDTSKYWIFNKEVSKKKWDKWLKMMVDR